MSARLRQLLHELADEVANVLEKDAANDCATVQTVDPAREHYNAPPRAKRLPKARLPPMPTSPPNEVAAARARRALQNAGFIVENKG